MTVTLYTRKGCHLCAEAKAEIETARRRAPFHYVEVDIDADPELRRLYNEEVPVIAVNGKKAFKYRLTAGQLLQVVAGRS